MIDLYIQFPNPLGHYIGFSISSLETRGSERWRQCLKLHSKEWQHGVEPDACVSGSSQVTLGGSLKFLGSSFAILDLPSFLVPSASTSP